MSRARWGNGGSTWAGGPQDRSEPRSGQHASARVSDEERSVAEMLAALTTDATLLLRQEVELAKAEVREEAKRTAKGAGMLTAAGVIGHLALLLLSFALAWGLAAVLHPGFAFLVVGVVYAAAAAVLAIAGRQRFQEAQAVPEQTVDTLREDLEWARDRIR